MKSERKQAQATQKRQELLQAFRLAATSVDKAETFLQNNSIPDDFIDKCNITELKVWNAALGSNSNIRHRNFQMRVTSKLKILGELHSPMESSSTFSHGTRSHGIMQLGDLSAREVIEYAEELTEDEIRAVIDWELNHKNRALVIKELQQMLPSQEFRSTHPTPPPTSKPADFGPNPYAEANRKAINRGRGFIQERCRQCGSFTPIDVELLSRILHARANTTRGRLQSFAQRQIESGSRYSGRIAASEQARANRNAFARQVSEGIPCSHCGAQLIRS